MKADGESGKGKEGKERSGEDEKRTATGETTAAGEEEVERKKEKESTVEREGGEAGGSLSYAESRG